MHSYTLKRQLNSTYRRKHDFFSCKCRLRQVMSKCNCILPDAIGELRLKHAEVHSTWHGGGHA